MSFVRFLALQLWHAIAAEETKTNLRGYCYSNREKAFWFVGSYLPSYGLFRCLSDHLPGFDLALARTTDLLHPGLIRLHLATKL